MENIKLDKVLEQYLKGPRDVEVIKEKFYLFFEHLPEDYDIRGMVVIGDLKDLGKEIHETFPWHRFRADGDDAWLSDFEGIVCSNGMVLLSAGNIYLDCPEPILDKLTEISDWIKSNSTQAKESMDWDWEEINNIPGYKDLFNTWIAGGDVDNWNNYLTNSSNSVTSTGVTNSSITSSSASLNTGTLTTSAINAINTASLDITSYITTRNEVMKQLENITGVPKEKFSN